MKTPIAPTPARPRHTDAGPLRFRAELPAVSAPSPAGPMPAALHDFLVPNPRPDLVGQACDVHGD